MCDHNSFSADRPIETLEEDILGRGKFAKSIAGAISNWHGHDSLVVALHGAWGSGKTSLKNMVLNVLKKQPNSKLDIIEFSPWEWAAQDKIYEAFFSEITTTIGKKDKQNNSKELATLFKRYGNYLNTAEIVTTGISKSLPNLFIILLSISSLGLFGNLHLKVPYLNEILYFITVVLAGWSAFFKWGEKLFIQSSKNIEDTLENQTLNSIRTDLINALNIYEKTIVIVMDDLDRLTPEQLRMAFQLIKANSEFPNVVFFLLYERETVEKMLTTAQHDGKAYLEKIIQVPFSVPQPELIRIHNVLFNQIKGIIKSDEKASQDFDELLWHYLFNGSIHIYFSNLRNVYRFVSTFSFHFSLLRERQDLPEVNPRDLLAIECLRVFEPELYSVISQSKTLLSRPNFGQHYTRNQEIFKTIIPADFSENKTQSIIKLLRQLFPYIESGASIDQQTLNKWSKTNRISHSSNFDKYFLLNIPSTQLSTDELHEMLNLSGNPSGFIQKIESLQQRGVLQEALTQFRALASEIKEDCFESFIFSMFEICDHVDHGSLGEYNSSATLIQFITFDILNRIPTREERGEILKKNAKRSSGLYLLENVLQNEESSQSSQSLAESLLADEHFEELKQYFVSELNKRRINSPRNLLYDSHLYSYLFRWQRWSDTPDNVKKWITDSSNDTNNFFQILRMLSRSITQSTTDNSTTKKVIIYDQASQIVDFDILRKMQIQISTNSKNLRKEEQELLEVFKNAWGEKEKAKLATIHKTTSNNA